MKSSRNEADEWWGCMGNCLGFGGHWRRGSFHRAGDRIISLKYSPRTITDYHLVCIAINHIIPLNDQRVIKKPGDPLGTFHMIGRHITRVGINLKITHLAQMLAALCVDLYMFELFPCNNHMAS